MDAKEQHVTEGHAACALTEEQMVVRPLRGPIPGRNPASGQVITLVQGGGVPEIDAAVQAAHRVR